MKNPGFLLIGVILSGLISGNVMAQDPALIKIDPDRKIGAVDPNIYGAFVEPVRTVVYGSIYDPSSRFADENGFRKDFIELARELKIPVVRWPGGNQNQGQHHPLQFPGTFINATSDPGQISVFYLFR
ncbi:MAG: hypothetical protein R6W81_03835 [Bacteroidales bacterium]